MLLIITYIIMCCYLHCKQTRRLSAEWTNQIHSSERALWNQSDDIKSRIEKHQKQRYDEDLQQQSIIHMNRTFNKKYTHVYIIYTLVSNLLLIPVLKLSISQNPARQRHPARSLDSWVCPLERERQQRSFLIYLPVDVDDLEVSVPSAFLGLQGIPRPQTELRARSAARKLATIEIWICVLRELIPINYITIVYTKQTKNRKLRR